MQYKLRRKTNEQENCNLTSKRIFYQSLCLNYFFLFLHCLCCIFCMTARIPKWTQCADSVAIDWNRTHIMFIKIYLNSCIKLVSYYLAKWWWNWPAVHSSKIYTHVRHLTKLRTINSTVFAWILHNAQPCRLLWFSHFTNNISILLIGSQTRRHREMQSSRHISDELTAVFGSARIMNSKMSQQWEPHKRPVSVKTIFFPLD